MISLRHSQTAYAKAINDIPPSAHQLAKPLAVSVIGSTANDAAGTDPLILRQRFVSGLRSCPTPQGAKPLSSVVVRRQRFVSGLRY